MNTLAYILDSLLAVDEYTERDINTLKMPVEIPNFGRDQLAGLFAELGFKKGVEVGVEQGEYSETLLKANPDLHLDAVDAWKAHKGYRDHTSQEKLDRFLDITTNRLSPYKDRCTIVKGFSMDVVDNFKDESLDFVYIDADHSFITVANDIYKWSKKVKKGGIVSGHDYIYYSHVHVKQVLQGYTHAYNIKPWFVLGRESKIEGEVRDSSRSWMFVKI